MVKYNPSATPAYLAGKIDEYVKQQGRDTLTVNASRDKFARYARIPDGRACDFCRMLGSRGFVYRSEELAGGGAGHGSRYDSYHPFCNCQVAVSFEPNMHFYMKGSVNGSRGYATGSEEVVSTGRDGSTKMRDIDIDDLYDEYLQMGKSFVSSGKLREYWQSIDITPTKLPLDDFQAAMQSLVDAETLDDLYAIGQTIVDNWPMGAAGRDSDQWQEMSRIAQERESYFIKKKKQS